MLDLVAIYNEVRTPITASVNHKTNKFTEFAERTECPEDSVLCPEFAKFAQNSSILDRKTLKAQIFP